MKFDNVGDIVRGTYTGKFEKEGAGALPAQVVVELTNASRGTSTVKDRKITSTKLEDMGDMNVGVKAANKFLIPKVNKLKVGDIVGFAFIEEIEAKPWMSPAKSIDMFIGGVDQAYLDSQKSAVFDDSGFE